MKTPLLNVFCLGVAFSGVIAGLAMDSMIVVAVNLVSFLLNAMAIFSYLLSNPNHNG